MKQIKNIVHKLLYLAAIGASIFLLFFVIACTWIGYEVKNQCQMAQYKYKGDCVEVLIAVLKDEKNTYHQRNDAIWSLGQLGDKRALPVLKSFYTGKIPAREPYNKMISQYELRKAINLAGGGINISAFIWRNGIGK